MPPKQTTVRLSRLLRELCDGEGDKITVREMVDHFGHRAFGAVLFTFSIPNILPLPPGASGVLGLPLVLVAPQLMIGNETLWLPRWLDNRQLDRKGLRKALLGFLPFLEKVERLTSPRLTFMFGPIPDRVTGLVAFLLALILFLPIPFGNMLPAAAIATLALSLIQRDGALAMLGYALACSSWAVLGLSAKVIIAAATRLLGFFGVHLH
jgi:hypothetical protein